MLGKWARGLEYVFPICSYMKSVNERQWQKLKSRVVGEAGISLGMFMFGLDSFSAKRLIVLGSKEAKPDNGHPPGVAKACGSVRK